MRDKATALVLLVVLGFYSVTIGWRGVALVRDGRPTAVLLGVGVLIVPLVALAAMVPLVRLARDGQLMLAEARAEPVTPGEATWRAELESAEVCRVAGDRGGEQRHYRAAVRAWRLAHRAQRGEPAQGGTAGDVGSGRGRSSKPGPPQPRGRDRGEDYDHDERRP